MKKLCKLFACLGLVVAISGCSSASKVSDEALDQLETSLNKISEMKSFAYDFGITENTQNTNIKIYGEMSQTGGLAVSLAADMKADTETVEKMIEVYVKDKTMYFSFLGMKQKQAMTDEQLNTTTSTIEKLELPKEDLKKNLEEASLSGNKLTLKVKPEVLNDALKASASTDASAVTNSISSFKSLVIEITLEDDFITSVTGTMVGEQDGTEVTMKLNATISNINKVDSVTYPNDLDTYLEGSNSGLLGQ